MAGELAYLNQFEGSTPPRSVWRGLIDEVRKRVMRLRAGRGGDSEVRHPWQVSVARAVEGDVPDVTDFSRWWRVEIVGGCVNAVPATIDGESLFVPSGPPWWVLETPDAQGHGGDFRKVSDALRPEYFFGAEFVEMDLWRAAVTVSAVRPAVPEVLLEIPPDAAPGALSEIGIADLPTIRKLGGPMRLACGLAPSALANPFGDTRLLADVYLTRNPKQPDPSTLR